MANYLLRTTLVAAMSAALVATTKAKEIAAMAATAGLAEAIVLTPQGGETPEDREIAGWQELAGRRDPKPQVFEGLGWAFVAKARRTLDAGYYKLAEQTAEAMEARFGASEESQLLRGHVLHNLHRFREAERLARALTGRRGTAQDFALLSDALMEQGRLGEAVEALQRMVNERPGAEAYSRIAHVRWLKGDLPGAIGAMEKAVQAGEAQGGALAAWLWTRLSGYYLQAGNYPAAQTAAAAALAAAPAYPPALLARGRVWLAMGEVAAAVDPLTEAARANPLPEYLWWLADALRSAGREAEAKETEAVLCDRGEASDPRTLALFLASRRIDTLQAVRLARAELDNRGDVFTHDALAWALAAKGELTAADREMQAALAEKTQDARLFWHAGEIARALGRGAEAEAWLARAAAQAATLTPGERRLLATRIGGGAALAKLR